MLFYLQQIAIAFDFAVVVFRDVPRTTHFYGFFLSTVKSLLRTALNVKHQNGNTINLIIIFSCKFAVPRSPVYRNVNQNQKRSHAPYIAVRMGSAMRNAQTQFFLFLSRLLTHSRIPSRTHSIAIASVSAYKLKHFFVINYRFT